MKPIPKLTKSDLARFWAKVDKTGVCWEWTGGIRNGYGRIKINGSMYRVHRISYAPANENPGDLCVCHTCDNPKCVNPAHLWLGTDRENIQDRDQKERQARGIIHKFAVLNESQVRDILASSKTHQDLAGKYGVSRANISYIKRGETWKHIKGVQVKSTSRANKNSMTGVKGVSPNGRRYKAQILIDGKYQHLGTFDTIEEAATAVEKARLC